MQNATLGSALMPWGSSLRRYRAEVVNGRDKSPWLRVQGLFAGDEAMKRFLKKLEAPRT